MKRIDTDGGEKAAGFKSAAGDCAWRAVAIATGRPYAEVTKELNAFIAKHERRKNKSSRWTGMHRDTFRRYMASIGWVWVPTMFIGQGCKVHLKDGELPMGRLVVNVSKHYTCVIDGVIHDTDAGDDRNGTRCVYGYWYEGHQYKFEANYKL